MGESHSHRVAVIGAGFSGLGLAIQLKQAGINDFVVLERANDLGGTWRDNDYPGCCCDIPSHVYSYSFALNKHWTRGFSPQSEILDYLQQTARRFGVLPHVRFDHEVLDACWDESIGRWRVQTTHGEYVVDYLVSAAGPLSDPTIPDLPGLGTFAGTTFHSARWNHQHDLTGERVAVIGTGASAIQFVPQIQPQASKLVVFQRTAPWVIPRFDHRITRLEHTLLRLPLAERVVRTLLYWLLEIRVVGFRKPWIMRIADRVARAHLKKQVPDPALRAKLMPGYVMGCKRILISDDYYPSLTQPNVDVVTSGIAEVRPHSIVTTDGAEYDVDTIIFGTGFHVIDAPIGQRIRGRGGSPLADRWGKSMAAYLGMTVSGFPNFFFMLGPNTGLGHNSMVFMIEAQVRYIVDALQTLDARRAASFEVQTIAEEEFDRWVQEQMRGTVWTAGACQSWYLDDTGRNPTLWPTWSWQYAARTRRFDIENYEVRYAA